MTRLNLLSYATMHQLSKIATMEQDGEKWQMVALDYNYQTNLYVIYLKASLMRNSNTLNVNPKSEIQNGIRQIV